MDDLFEHLDSLGYHEIFPEQEVSSSYVEEVEKALGCHLPDDYRAFLDRFPRSGGCDGEAVINTPYRSHEFPDGNVCWMKLSGFDSSYGLIEKNLQSPDYAREGRIIIGNDPFGNLIYLAVGDPCRPGEVSFFNRMGEDTADTPTFISIAPTFSEFIMCSYLEE